MADPRRPPQIFGRVNLRLPDAGLEHGHLRHHLGRVVRRPDGIFSQNVLADSIATLGLMIAFYYGINGIISPMLYRGTSSRA